MNKYICVRETYDWIYIGDEEGNLNKYEFEMLLEYLDDKDNDLKMNLIDIKYKKLRFINYVGIISVSNIVIDILPKISLSNDTQKDKNILLDMIYECNKVSFNDFEKNITAYKNYNLIDSIAIFFINELKKQVDNGIYLEYIDKEDNLGYVKGKILLNNHIKINLGSNIKVYCNYDEFGENNFLNKVFKSACMMILNKVDNSNIKNELKEILISLNGVNLENIGKEKLINYRFNKQNYRFQKSYELAKMILLNLAVDNTIGNESCYYMLLEIHILYEKYISNIICKLWNSEYKKCIVKDNGKYLLKNKTTLKDGFRLNPDLLLIDNKNNSNIIIDTKWKAFNNRVRISDIYQMYAYITRYENIKRCILLYPYIADVEEVVKWNLFEPFQEKTIEVKMVRLDDINNTIKDLLKILE